MSLAGNVKYLDRLERTRAIQEVAYAIEDYRDSVAHRLRRSLPH
jgi:hypothetical protein